MYPKSDHFHALKHNKIKLLAAVLVISVGLPYMISNN
jgi:hypothetical protein